MYAAHHPRNFACWVRYKLTCHACQALQSVIVTDSPSVLLSCRYPPIAGAALMEQLSRTHESVNASRDELASAAAAHDSFPTPQQAVATAAATGADFCQGRIARANRSCSAACLSCEFGPHVRGSRPCCVWNAASTGAQSASQFAHFHAQTLSVNREAA